MKTKILTIEFITVCLLLMLGISYTEAQPVYQYEMLAASDKGKLDRFGYSVDIYGETVVIGSIYDDTGNIKSHGSAYIFEKNQDNWLQKEKIVASDMKAGAFFGKAVDIYQNYIIVGAPKDNSGGEKSGAAYIFAKDDTGNWVQKAKLVPDDIKPGLGFGYDVAICGDYAIVGALDEDTNENETGIAYIFYKDKEGVNEWVQIKKITASGNEIGNWFGFAVDITDGYAIVGAWQSALYGEQSGLAYIFKKDKGGINNWGQLKILKPDGLNSYFGFGYSVDFDKEKDKVIISAVGENTKGTAYIFEKNKGGSDNWGQITKLVPYNGKFNDQFGYSVSISGDIALVGAPEHYKDGDRGVVYMYRKDEGGSNKWGLVNELIPVDTFDRGSFGKAVGIYDDYSVIGARNKSLDFKLSGAAYVFGPALPRITKHPISTGLICLGANINYTVEGYNIKEYQWRVKYDGTGVWEDIVDNDIFSGSKTSTLSVIAQKKLDNSTFSCKVSNEYGDVISIEATFNLNKFPPVIKSKHPDTTLTADENCEAVLVDFTKKVVATDFCLGNLVVTQSPEKGTKIKGSTNKITLTVTDEIGNFSTIKFNVSVIDKMNPVISCVESKTVQMEAGASYFIVKDTQFDPLTLSDNCSGVYAVNNFNNKSTLKGAQLPVGSTTIIWTAIDAADNKSDCSFDITVEYPSSVESAENETVKIFPNPSNGIAYVEAGQIQKITIMDVFGKVYDIRLQDDSSIDLTDFSPGIYFLKIKTAKRKVIKKIFIQ